MDKAKEYLYGTSINAVPAEDYFERKLALWPAFKANFSIPCLRNLRILDVGCGHGAFVVAAAKEGSQAVGVDTAYQKFLTGWQKSPQLIQRGGGSVEFFAGDAAFLEAKPFDVMISYETLEHMDNLPDVLANLHTLLKPGGHFYVCWGGMWPSVFGGHYWLQKHLFGLPIPWSHRLFTRKHNRPGVNQLAYIDYVKIIAASPFELVSWRNNVGDHWGYKVFRLLAKVPGLRDAFTQNSYVVLRR